jgi:hypothetical protein
LAANEPVQNADNRLWDENATNDGGTAAYRPSETVRGPVGIGRIAVPCPNRLRSQNLFRTRVVLSVNDDQSGSRDLQLWAVGQLVALHLLEADQALERYRAEINKLPAKSSAKERLYPVGESIYQLMVQRSRRG